MWPDRSFSQVSMIHESCLWPPLVRRDLCRAGDYICKVGSVAVLMTGGTVLAAPGIGNVSLSRFPEGSSLRTATCAAAGFTDGTGSGRKPTPRLGGPDAARFELDGAAIRFRVMGDDGRRHRILPDFERPADRDGDNRYDVTVIAGEAGGADEITPLCAFAIEITDRDEPGRVSLSTRRPQQGEKMEAILTDPDEPLDGLAWRWQRSIGRDTFVDIVGATGSVYIPTAADTGRLLRATVSYRDRHSAGPGREKAVSAVTAADAVLGPRLTGLAAHSESYPSGRLNPPFDPSITHYAVACDKDDDVLSLTFAADSSVRVDVNGIQPRPGSVSGAAAPVTWTSDVVVTVAADDGAATRYILHCAPPDLAGLLTRAGADLPPGLSGMRLAIALRAWVAVIDAYGVPRIHWQVSDEEHVSAGFFLLPFGVGEERRYVHSRPAPRPPETPRDTPRLGRAWQIVDAADLSPLRRVTAAPPLVTTGVHDFRLLEDGSALLMTYEPAVRDFAHLSESSGATSVVFHDPEGKPWGEAVETDDSAIQIVGADGTARWTWNSWGRMPLEDCAQHRFPRDYAHVNSVQMTSGGVLASFRGCSSVMLIDPAGPETPAGGGIVWRIGASNLSAGDWAARGLGPAPLALVGDPEGAFCGQHAATLIEDGVPEPRLLLFDNGVQCVTDPATGEPLGRAGGDYSRGVEYALDLEHGEAVFVRDASLGGRRDALGAIGGHLAVLDDGSWLISWGWTGSDPAPPATVVSRVDPATGGKGFALLRAGLPEGVPAVRAVPLPAAALEVPPEPLTGFFPEAGPLAAEDGDAGGNGAAGLSVAVAFSRPVAAFGAGTPSIAVEGGRLVSAAPWRAFGKPAHAWRLGILPASGGSPLRVSLRPGVSCREGGLCAADGTLLTGPPAVLEIDPEVGKARKEPRPGDNL